MDPKTIIAECLTRPENQLCADCQKSAPNWASANLGIFLCIDCSGIHRSLGTHISYVRSCTLDSWTMEQAQKMTQIGNAKSNQFYEATLPKDFKRPDNSNRYLMTQFIRDKYVMKKWAGSDNPSEHVRIQMPEPAANKPKVSSSPKKQPIITRAQSEFVSLSKKAEKDSTNEEEVDIFGEPIKPRKARVAAQPPQPSQVSTSERKPGTRIPARLMKKMQGKNPGSRRSEPNLHHLAGDEDDDPFA